MRRSRIRHLVPIKAPTRPLELATAAELGITDEEHRERLFRAAVLMVFEPGPGDTMDRRVVSDEVTITQFHLAIRMLRRLLRDDPNHAMAWGVLGAAYSGVNEYLESERAFRRAYELDPKNPDIAQGVFYAAMNSGDYELALEAATTMAEAIPDQSELLLPIAYAEIMLGRLDNALRTIESLGDRRPNDERSQTLATVVNKYRDGSLPAPAHYGALKLDCTRAVFDMIRGRDAHADEDSESDGGLSRQISPSPV